MEMPHDVASVPPNRAAECYRPAMTRRQYSIVVVGRMNPSIHHPLWYEIIGGLSEAEVACATGVVLTPEFSRFETSGLEIVCLAGRWQVKTSKDELASRVVEVAKSVFDRLADTPIDLFALNYDWWSTTSSDDVGTLLGGAVSSLPLGFSNAPMVPRLAHLVMKYPLPDLETREPVRVSRELSTHLLTDDAPNTLHVIVNVEHKLANVGNKVKHFEFSKIVESALQIQAHVEALHAQVLNATLLIKG